MKGGRKYNKIVVFNIFVWRIIDLKFKILRFRLLLGYEMFIRKGLQFEVYEE